MLQYIVVKKRKVGIFRCHTGLGYDIYKNGKKCGFIKPVEGKTIPTGKYLLDTKEMETRKNPGNIGKYLRRYQNHIHIGSFHYQKRIDFDQLNGIKKDLMAGSISISTRKSCQKDKNWTDDIHLYNFKVSRDIHATSNSTHCFSQILNSELVNIGVRGGTYYHIKELKKALYKRVTVKTKGRDKKKKIEIPFHNEAIFQSGILSKRKKLKLQKKNPYQAKKIVFQNDFKKCMIRSLFLLGGLLTIYNFAKSLESHSMALPRESKIIETGIPKIPDFISNIPESEYKKSITEKKQDDENKQSSIAIGDILELPENITYVDSWTKPNATGNTSNALVQENNQVMMTAYLIVEYSEAYPNGRIVERENRMGITYEDMIKRASQLQLQRYDIIDLLGNYGNITTKYPNVNSYQLGWSSAEEINHAKILSKRK